MLKIENKYPNLSVFNNVLENYIIYILSKKMLELITHQINFSYYGIR